MTSPNKFVECRHLDPASFRYDPEFGYRRPDIYDGKFVMIAQLQMICVDISTGNKLWKI